MLSQLTTLYLFLGGTGGGALVVLGALELTNSFRQPLPSRPGGVGFLPRERPPLQGPLFSEALGTAWLVALVALASGALCLLLDLGRPEKASLLIFPRVPSAIGVGTWSLSLSLVCATLFTAKAWLTASQWPRIFTRALAVLGIFSGLATATYTGVLLQSMAAILAWRTPLIAVLFVLSSLSCGIAVLLGSAALSPSRTEERALATLASLDSVVIAIEAFSLALYVGWLFSSQGTLVGAQELIAGALAPLFWGGLAGGGLLAPLALEQAEKVSGSRELLFAAALLVLVGGAALRLTVCGLAAFDITQGPLWTQALIS